MDLNLLDKKCFHILSWLGVIIFVIVGTSVLVFLPIYEASERKDFSCYNTEGKETSDQLRDRCYDEYNKKINRDIPLYAFGWLNFICVMLICITYSQCVRGKVKNIMEATNVNHTSQQSTALLSPCEEPPENHGISHALNVGDCRLKCKVFTAYSVHLLIKSIFMTMFLVIQWGVIRYPKKFPATFDCKLMRNPNNSTGNTTNDTSTAATVSDCKNGKAWIKTIVAILVFSVTTLFLVLSVFELFCLFLLKMKSENFTSDTQFCRNYLNSSNNAISCTNIATNLEGNNLPPYVIAFQVLPQHPTHEVISRDDKVSTIVDKLNELHTNNNGELTYFYLSGNPGSGKSQLARQIGKSYHSDNRKKQSGSTFVMTLNGKTPESLLESYQDFARRFNCTETVVASILNSDQTTEVKIRQLRTQITTRIKNYMSWFIIVDNVEDLKLVSSLLPELGSEEWKGGQVLVTTQDSTHIPSNGSLNQHVSISPGMSVAEASHLLATVSGTTSDDPMLKEVAKVLDYQPLALAAAAVYLKHVKESNVTSKFSWYNYLQKLDEGKRRLTEEQLSESNPAYSHTMTTAVLLAVEKTAETDIVLKHTFHFLSLASHDSLPLEVVINYVLLMDKDQDREQVGVKIRKCSLILSADDEKKSPSIRLHRVTHDAIKINSARLDDKVTIFKLAVASFYQFKHLDVDKRSLIPHLKAFYVAMGEMFQNCRTSSNEIWESCIYFGEILRKYSEFVLSKQFLTAALNICMDQDEPDQFQMAISYSYLGRIHNEFGNFQQAKKFHERALDIFIKELGPDHFNTACAYNDLGRVYTKLNDPQQAKKFFQQALDIFIKQSGPVTYSYNNLGNIHEKLGDLKESKEFHERALQICIKQLEPNHISIGNSYYNLGILHTKLGNLQEAKDFHERALDIRLEQLGPNHVHVARSYNCLGKIHKILGDLKQAKDFHKLALDIRMKQLKRDRNHLAHPNNIDISHSYNHLVKIYNELGDLQQAKEFHEYVLEIFIKQLGPIFVHNRLAHPQQHKEFFERALDIFIKQYS